MAVAINNNIWPLAFLAAYFEGEEEFKGVLSQYCSKVFPEQNTLAMILPFILSNKKGYSLFSMILL